MGTAGCQSHREQAASGRGAAREGATRTGAARGRTLQAIATGRMPGGPDLLEIQRLAGNRAAAAVVPRMANPTPPSREDDRSGAGSGAGSPSSRRQVLPVQRGLTDLLFDDKKKKASKAALERRNAADKSREMGRMTAQVQQWIDYRNELVEGGTPPDEAAHIAFSKAPADVKPYLPLHSEFDTMKQEIDRTRREEGGTTHGAVSHRLDERAKELGYKPGLGDPTEMKPKEAAEELQKDLAFRRQMERRAERLLLGERESASARVKVAEQGGDQKAIAEAKGQLAKLSGPEAVQAKLFDMAMSANQRIEEVAAKKIEEHRATGAVSNAEKWRLREKAKIEVREELENSGSTREKIDDAGSAAGTVAKVGGIAGQATSTGIKREGGSSLSSSQLAEFSGVAGSLGVGFRTVGGLFSEAVKLVGQVSDHTSDKLDKDAYVEIAQQALGLVNEAVSSARSSMLVAEKFQETLKSDPGFANAIPGLAIATGVMGFVGNVLAVVPPTQRWTSTTIAWHSTRETKNRPLKAALSRTMLENRQQITTEMVDAVANAIIVAASIAEIASAGGFGVPAGIRLGAIALNGAKKVIDFAELEAMRSKTQEARKEGALQTEGSGKKLIKTDITYAVDTIIVSARKSFAKAASGAELTKPEQSVIDVIESYGITPTEAQRLSVREMHDRMLAKIDQDDDQSTVGMQLDDGLKSAKEALAALGGEKEEEYVDLDTYARGLKETAIAEANKTTTDKALEGLATVGGYLEKGVKSPKKIGQMATEKAEKVRRLREIKNEVNYKDRSDRGGGFAFTQFSEDLDPSIKKLRRFIVATQPPAAAAVYLRELNTLAEQEKVGKKSGAKVAAEKRSLDKVSDSRLSSGIIAEARMMTFSQVRERLASEDLSLADRKYLREVLAQKVF